MAVLVMQLDVLSHGTLEYFGSRVPHNSQLPRGDLEVDADANAVPRTRTVCPRAINRRGGMQTLDWGHGHSRVTTADRSTFTSSPPAYAGSGTSGPRGTASYQTHQAVPFTFARGPSLRTDRFIFPDRPPVCPRQGIKRRRSATDVDGPNTASLSCKKRRLRRDLITSRLSCPFSLPATHILNREDKRFLKLAAIVAARRMSISAGGGAAPAPDHHHPSPSGMLRRAAIINRFRLRVYRHAASRGDSGVAQVAGQASLLQLSQGIGVVTGARFFPATAGGMAPAGSSRAGPLPYLPALPHGLPHPLSRAAAAATGRLPPPTQLAVSPPPQQQQEHREQQEQRVTPARERELDPQEARESEYGCAFPSAEYADSQYVDEEDEEGHDGGEVYADFGVIFGGGSDADSDEEYQDYMDDLDGIPWSAR